MQVAAIRAAVLAKLSDHVRLPAVWLARWMLCASRMASIALSELTSSVIAAFGAIEVEEDELIVDELLVVVKGVVLEVGDLLVDDTVEGLLVEVVFDSVGLVDDDTVELGLVDVTLLEELELLFVPATGPVAPLLEAGEAVVDLEATEVEAEAELEVKLVERVLGRELEEPMVLPPIVLRLLLVELDKALDVLEEDEADDVVEPPIGLRMLLELLDEDVVEKVPDEAVLVPLLMLVEVERMDDVEVVEPPTGPTPLLLLVVEAAANRELLEDGLGAREDVVVFVEVVDFDVWDRPFQSDHGSLLAMVGAGE